VGESVRGDASRAAFEAARGRGCSRRGRSRTESGWRPAPDLRGGPADLGGATGATSADDALSPPNHLHLSDPIVKANFAQPRGRGRHGTLSWKRANGRPRRLDAASTWNGRQAGSAGRRQRKKPAWRNTVGCSGTPAYSTTGPRHRRVAPRPVCRRPRPNRYQIQTGVYFASTPNHSMAWGAEGKWNDIPCPV
jgi:hypothetical protein